MDRNDERATRARRSRAESNENINNYDATPADGGETGTRRRRSQAARIREDTLSMQALDVTEDTYIPSPRDAGRQPSAPPRIRAREIEPVPEDTIPSPRETLDARRRFSRPEPARPAVPANRSRNNDDDFYDDTAYNTAAYASFDDEPEPVDTRRRRQRDLDDFDELDEMEETRSRKKAKPAKEQRPAKAAKPSKKSQYARDEYDDYDDYDDEYDDDYDDDEPPRKRRPIVWIIIALVIVALLGGITFVGLNNPDLIQPVVEWGRNLIGGATPTPEPTLEPTPEPVITAEPLPDVSAASVVEFSADPVEQPDVGSPVTFFVTTTNQTTLVDITDDNGQRLIEGIEGDYTDTAEGRQWQLRVTFPDAYEGFVEATPGNESGWNYTNGSRIQVKVGSAGAAMATGASLASGGFVAESVERSGQAIDKTGALESFERQYPIDFGDATGYIGANGMNGVVAFRGSGMRQNAAYGAVSPTESRLESVWTASAGVASTGENSFGSQPLIVQWHANIRELMPLSGDKSGKSQLKEVIFASNDGRIYFFDLDDGQSTRDPITGRKETNPMMGTPSVYPMGVPLLAVGTGNPSLNDATANTGLMIFNLLSNKDVGTLSGRNEDAYSSDATVITSPLIDNSSDTVLSVGGNGLLYGMRLNTKMDDSEEILTIAPTVDIFRSGEEGEVTTVDGSMAGYGKYVYYATNGGVLTCVDVNAYSVVWALNIGADSDAAVAIGTGGSTIFHATMADADGLAHLRAIDAATGSVKWDVSVPGDIQASPLIGTGVLDGKVFVTAANSEAGATIYALDAATGSQLWEYGIAGTKATSPIALYGENGGAWIVQGDESGLLLLDAETGERADYLGLDSSVYGSPAAFDDMIVVATENGKLHGVRIK